MPFVIFILVSEVLPPLSICFFFLFHEVSLLIALIAAKGQFTYWSMRTFARPVNRGIRLDYFICNKEMFVVDDPASAKDSTTLRRLQPALNVLPRPAVFDSYILHEDTVGCSDHCPVALVVAL